MHIAVVSNQSIYTSSIAMVLCASASASASAFKAASCCAKVGIRKGTAGRP